MVLTILKLLSSLPGMLTLIDKWVGEISAAWAEHVRQRNLNQFQEGIDHAQASKDTCELERKFDPSLQCPGDHAGTSDPSGVPKPGP